MKVIPHVYYSLEATDLALSPDMRSMHIPAAVDKRENPFDDFFILSKEEKQKTSRELITLTQNFCRKMYNVSDKYSPLPYKRPTYKITMCRNAMVNIYDNDLGGVSISNTIKLRAVNNGIFDFIYNKANKLIYASNICQILKQDLKWLCIYDINGRCVPFDKVSEYLDPYTTPLYVYRFDAERALVQIIPNNTVVVNDKMCEIHPQVTGHIPAHMSLLFNNKTEPVRRAYSQRHRSH